MIEEEIIMHLAAGRYYGRAATCGKKIRHPDLRSAEGHARSLNNKQIFSPEIKPHIVEAYPCYWCSERFPDSDDLDFTHLYWHVGREMDEKERNVFSSSTGTKILEMEVIQINATEPQWGIPYSGLVGLRVHNRKQCEGQACCIHHPSNHHMKEWPLNWRGDRGIMERLCVHYAEDGSVDYTIGHPDLDDASFRRIRDGEKADPGVHGCDGCCAP